MPWKICWYKYFPFPLLENIMSLIFSNNFAQMKNEILDTALKQFLKHGIREMSIQKLIEPLGISTKTVYKYFKNKEDLLEEVLHLYHAQQYKMLENLSEDQKAVPLFFDIWHSAIEITYNVNKVFFKDLRYYYPELNEKIEKAVSKKYIKKFIQIIQKGIQEGVFKESIIPEVVLDSVLVLYAAIVREEVYKKFRIPLYDILSNTIVLYMRGFCTDKGIQELDEHIQSFKTNEGVRVISKIKTVSHL